MLRHVIILQAFCVFLAASSSHGPKYPPTKGALWPKAQSHTKTDTYYKLTPSAFTITEKGQTCDILKTAIERYTNVLRNTHLIAERHSQRLMRILTRHHSDTAFDGNYKGTLQELQINLTSPCETYPHLDMDEKYTLDVSAVSTLHSDSIWGVLRGLESFAQLFYMSDGYKNVLINATSIVDFPMYTHRGLLIDTSRHYLSVSTILKTLDAMEMNKMNVLHWHIVDDQSFPYQSEVFPQLSELGAYHPTKVYTAADIDQIVNYARDRGIRVLPEFDIPGHTRSWGVAYPSILSKCYRYGVLGWGPIDPTKNMTHKVLGDLIREVQGRFPDKYFHLGGDDVELDCWDRNNTEIVQFMRQHSLEYTRNLYSLFISRVVVPLLGDRSKPIVWQDMFDSRVYLKSDAIVQVVSRYYAPTDMKKVLEAGHKVVYSASWNLDEYDGGGDWFKYYGIDPRSVVDVPESKKKDILGGEAIMNSHLVDDTNMVSRVWPRASAVAEQLWNVYNATLLEQEISSRLEEHACRMNRRGVHAQPPNGAGFCITGNYS